MRSFGAAALFILAVVTECSSAKSERSRSRSGPIRSVPVAADIKRDVDFDCPEEFGYYPHPTDCTLYYVCVFGGALLESCTGGLMYSHELQTCDWPRNVGCDGTSAAGGEELERTYERDPPPPPPPRRTPPPPPPRAQPNPVITSRGQPKLTRQEYEKQQQLYAEVDDLPPVEEIESDRQQRVYRGQPATIGQVQKDRDGYVAQQSSERTLNSNIIPASIPQNSGKIGSFSFGSQVDERRTATVTTAPQSYSEDKTDYPHDRLIDIETNEINDSDSTDKPILRKKREVVENKVGLNASSPVQSEDVMSKRSDSGEEMEYIEIEPDDSDEEEEDETERGKRQIGYYIKNGRKFPSKHWAVLKPVKAASVQQPRYHKNPYNNQQQPNYNYGHGNKHYEGIPQQHSQNNNLYSVSNPFLSHYGDSSQAQQQFRPSLHENNLQTQQGFRPSLQDPASQSLSHSPLNSATQIITKSPPISSLSDNLYNYLAGGFYNNAPKPHNVQYFNQYPSAPAVPHGPKNSGTFPDSSHGSSTIITDKPIPGPTSPKTVENYRGQDQVSKQIPNQHIAHGNQQQNQQLQNNPNNNRDYDDEESDEDDEESDDDEEEEDDDRPHYDFPEPPYEFTHPSYKYKDINNPFANPDFDFDAYLSKLSNGQYSTGRPVQQQQQQAVYNSQVEASTPPTHQNYKAPGSTASYSGMSTPKPFAFPSGPGSSVAPIINSPRPSVDSQNQEPLYNNNNLERPETTQYTVLQQHQPQQFNDHNYGQQQTAGIHYDSVRPKLNPPNFKDERQLPINYNFDRPVSTTQRPNHDNYKDQRQQSYSVTPNPFLVVTGTGVPIILSTPQQQYLIKPENIIPLLPQGVVSTGKPYLVSSIKPHNTHLAIKQSTAKPLSTIANEQLSALQYFWNGPTTGSPIHFVSIKPSTTPNILKLEKLFAQAIKSAQMNKTQSNFQNYTNFLPTTTTTKAPPKRRPIPKPSPEMNDYYYDDEEEQYYYEPAVKPKYMPSTEVKPQRPPMAQNYKEYDDNFNNEPVKTINIKPKPTQYSTTQRYSTTKYYSTPKPTVHTTRKPVSSTKNHNDVSLDIKAPLKDFSKNINGKIPVPVLVDSSSPPPTLTRPETKPKIVHPVPRNRTMHMIRRPIIENGPNTMKPPKYLNQTTLRPYTVRHRLAKPTSTTDSSVNNDDKQTKGRIRHPNIVAQMKVTTPPDSHNQETRYTKTKHDGKTNSLEPTESVAPVSYSASPRPKMLYNGSQNYSPDQYDPYYAVYDEDSELYKDTDYVQQYNTASLRPAVQQTYRGTPPPARRPVETYSPRPVPVDYDDELIQPQINNQNQFQTPIRHSTRGEGNELGYDHNPSSVKTTLYEATTTIRTTTPTTTTTTSTSTTTQRPITAPYTEAMTPSRNTPRLSTDESPKPESSPRPSDEPTSSTTTTPSPIINFSSLAKPFEKTDNSHRLRETLSTTEKIVTTRRNEVTNNNHVRLLRPKSNQNNKKHLSLTSGFSIRRNLNNTNNPYTLTLLSRPFEDFNNSKKIKIQNDYEEKTEIRKHFENKQLDSQPTQLNRWQTQVDTKQTEVENRQIDLDAAPVQSGKYYDDSITNQHQLDSIGKADPTNIIIATLPNTSTRRKDFSSTVSEDDEDIPVFVRPTSRVRTVKSRTKVTLPPSTTATYHVRNNNNRPTPNSPSYQKTVDSTENVVNTEALIELDLQNAGITEHPISYNSPQTGINEQENSQNTWDRSPMFSYKHLDNLRSVESNNNEDAFKPITSTTEYKTSTYRSNPRNNRNRVNKSRTKPSYYSYQLEDEVPDQTTEIFNGKVKNVINAFLNNFVSSSEPVIVEDIPTTSLRPTTPIKNSKDQVVNIGFQKKQLKYVDEKPLRGNVKILQIVTEPNYNQYVAYNDQNTYFKENQNDAKDFSSTTTMTTMSSSPLAFAHVPTTPMTKQNSENDFRSYSNKVSHQSKFSNLVTNRPDIEDSQKFQQIVDDGASAEKINSYNDGLSKLTDFNSVDDKYLVESDLPSEIDSEIASTTSTTKATTTAKIEPMTTTTKSTSFPTRASRVNPAIKLAATNPGGGRRSYQSSSKCASDNSLQANPKCNEIKYQRPTSTRGRGSAHYSTSGADVQSQPAPNRGTPPTRSRPTLKPSTAIVSKSTEFVDIYAYPPNRPAPVYPQPTPDKTAAKCRKDVCLLPDCYCGGKDIPGDLPLEQTPQIVLLTFDDSVNDLNKVLYSDLFEKGRVNPNGCPISATFYVSHEWTDYSQVQNLYSAGHEMASHTISHSFGEQFSQKKWYREVGGQREILSAYGGVKLEDIRGMRAPFLSVGGNKMFKMLYDANFTYDSSLPVYENKPPSWPYTLDYKLFHDCMIPPCPTKSYPGVWEVPMVMWQDLNGGRCSMGDACANPPEPENVYKMILKNFDRHYTTNRAPFGLFYHAAWFTQPHHKEGFIMFLDFINQMPDVWIVTNWQALQWVRDPTPISRLNNFQPFQCNYQDRPKKCNNPKVCNLWHKSGVRYMRTCQPCPEVYPWTGKSGIRSSRIDNDIGE